MTEPIDEAEELLQVAEFQLACPECETPVNVGVLLKWSLDEEAGTQMMTLHPDLTDIWAHSFIHQG
jgi:hypothetical protein